jgi:steroid delta-isomerase-like uncharacterized protein
MKEAAMATDDPTTVAREVVEAFNAADWDRFRAVLADGIVYEETGTGRRVEGAEEYVRLCQGWRQAFPDVTGTIRRVVAEGGTVAEEIAWAGSHQGPLETPGGTIPASGAQVEALGTLWVTVSGGEASAIRHHLDVMALLRQVGALPGA